MQQGMLFHETLAPRSGSDFEQMVMRVGEEIDAVLLAEAWAAAAGRHDVLRTWFRWTDGSAPRQFVQPAVSMEVVRIDQTTCTESQAEQRLHEFLATDRARGFDLATAPLSRVTIFDRSPSSTVIVWSFHHIILDGRSFPIVISDVFAFYDARHSGEPGYLGPSIPYRTFIDHLAAVDDRSSSAYWKTALAGFTSPTPLVVDRIGRISTDDQRHEEVRASLDALSTRALETIAADFDVTLNTTIQAAWALLLARYGRTTDVVFGATRSGRHGTIDGADTIAGLFINTVPMRVAVPSEQRVDEWLRTIRAQHIAMRPHEHTPLTRLQVTSEVTSGTPLFDSILVFEAYQLDPMMRARANTGDRVEYELLEQTNYPLLLSVYGGDLLELRLEFDRSRFDPSVAERMLGHLVTLLRSMIDHSSGIVADLDCIGDDELWILTHDWCCNPHQTPPTDLVSRWREAAAAWPDRLALVGSKSELSFGELDAASDLLARALVREGAGPGAIIGILLDRSTEAVVAVLGVLKTGGAYLPLDPGYPIDRLNYMIDDSGTSLLLADRRTSQSEVVAHGNVTTLLVDDLGPPPTSPVSFPEIDSGSPAYVIYTSGTSGDPKGVVVSHESLVNHAEGVGDAYGLQGDDRVLQFAALSFDVAAEELFPTWQVGAAVVLRSEEVAGSFEALRRCVELHRITVLNLPSGYWATWVDHLTDRPGSELPPTLRLVVVGSDKVSTAHHERWTKIARGAVRWLNAYGPTEATVTATVFDPVGADPVPGALMPVGRPIRNVAVYVLDSRGRVTPIGVPGELHIGGSGVAIGYLGRPELTAEKFVPDTLASTPGGRLYRTGDLARWLPDGQLEFLDRVDDQVKIRGYRIELGEIEATLLAHAAVREAVVTAYEHLPGDVRLAAFVVLATPDAHFDVEVLRSALGGVLPHYMIPSGFVPIERVPLTANGKIDRAALQIPSVVPVDPDQWEAPEAGMERELAQIWERCLGVVDVGRRQNFFDLGGHSLLAIRVFAQIEQLTGRAYPLTALFSGPTVAELAEVIRADVRASPFTSLVAVQPAGSKRPFFSVSPFMITPLSYQLLARHLGFDQPLYVFQPRGMENDEPVHETIEDMAQHYISEMKLMQPQGPYLIGGHCAGTWVALEMAIRLEATGDSVGLLVLVDSEPPHVTNAPSEARVRRAVSRLMLYRRDGRLRPALEWKLGLAKQRFWLRWTGDGNHRRVGAVRAAHRRAYAAFRPRAFSGDALLVSSQETVDLNELDTHLRWSEMINGELRSVVVPGTHATLMRSDDAAQVLAVHIAQAFAEVVPDHTVIPG